MLVECELCKRLCTIEYEQKKLCSKCTTELSAEVKHRLRVESLINKINKEEDYEE